MMSYVIHTNDHLALFFLLCLSRSLSFTHVQSLSSPSIHNDKASTVVNEYKKPPETSLFHCYISPVIKIELCNSFNVFEQGLQ